MRPQMTAWYRKCGAILPIAMLAVAAIAAVASPFSAPPAAGDPLRDEDVVRWYVAGVAVQELIARIEAAEVQFDLDPEMLDELRGAGLPERVVQAMIDRQRALHGEQEQAKPAPSADEPAMPVLRVLLEPEWEPTEKRPRPVLRVPETVPPGIVEALGLPDDDARFSDIAVILACLHPVHVPDHWRGQSPLGRDFVSTPRHRLLAFHPGARRAARGAGSAAVLELELPEALEASVNPADTHDLLLGVALQIDDRFYLVARDELPGLSVAANVEIEATIRGADRPSVSGLRVEFVDRARTETP